jgi:cob(I)alamin adenosyltransferase
MAERRGLLILLTGDGKGKTTAAIGLAVRALGAGLRTSILQFIKERETGEHRALAQVAGDRIEVLRLGSGFVLGKPPPAEAVAAARKALELARARLTGGRFDMVVLDEVFPALAAELVCEQEILELADLRPPQVHLVLTGCGAPQSVIERADLVTEMRCVKHPHDRGVEAQPGIEL